MFVDEFDDGCTVIQSVHMSDSGFDDHLHGAPQCSISLLQQQGIFLNGNNVISISADVQQRDGCCGQRLQMIDGTEGFFCEGLFVSDVVYGLQFADFSVAAFACSASHGPAADITDGCITEDARDLCGIGGSPVVAVEASATCTHKSGSRSEVMIAGQHLVDLIPVADRDRGSEQITTACVHDMEAASEESDVRDGAMTEEFTVPDPWPTCGRLSGDDDGDGVTVEFEIGTGKAVPCGAISWKFCSLCLGIPGEHQQDGQQENVRVLNAHVCGFLKRVGGEGQVRSIARALLKCE